MPLRFLIAAVALLALSACASTGSGDINTTYAQWQGAYPEPEFTATDTGSIRISY
ncbi:hypothetical protein ILFOPFJJ_03880 [Ensifer psoraleae]|uniref:hypothetical protein n=1 Tax=Sinorhizobium sp. 7-81 TaxID=3049087 RepID=UPI0024ABE163|nr:hypothetical protein [Sinorhizobium sp. 7-81]MDK1385856.1 hypothetical protein [Sinorhizobium sp. 7-81]NRP72981.1 hypothetical protein [Sinorhizobium psoraleae]